MRAAACACVVLAVVHVEAFVGGAARLQAVASQVRSSSSVRMAADGACAAKQHD
jgi:hypothetical protein